MGRRGLFRFNDLVELTSARVIESISRTNWERIVLNRFIILFAILTKLAFRSTPDSGSCVSFSFSSSRYPNLVLISVLRTDRWRRSGPSVLSFFLGTLQISSELISKQIEQKLKLFLYRTSRRRSLNNRLVISDIISLFDFLDIIILQIV